MSHALAPRVCSLPLAAACRVTLHQVNGITGRGINCGNNESSSLAQQALGPSALVGKANIQRGPSHIAASPAGNGAEHKAAAMADIRTMLIDLDDCLYDIPVRPSGASDRIQTAKRRVTASMQMRSQQALPVLPELIWRQALRRHSVTPHASHSMTFGLASRTAQLQCLSAHTNFTALGASHRQIATAQPHADSPRTRPCRSSHS